MDPQYTCIYHISASVFLVQIHNHYCFRMAVLFGRVMLKVSPCAIFMLTVLNCNITKTLIHDIAILKLD